MRERAPRSTSSPARVRFTHPREAGGRAAAARPSARQGPDCMFRACARTAQSGRSRRARLDPKGRITGRVAVVGTEARAGHTAPVPCQRHFRSRGSVRPWRVVDYFDSCTDTSSICVGTPPVIVVRRSASNDGTDSPV